MYICLFSVIERIDINRLAQRERPFSKANAPGHQNSSARHIAHGPFHNGRGYPGPIICIPCDIPSPGLDQCPTVHILCHIIARILFVWQLWCAGYFSHIKSATARHDHRPADGKFYAPALPHTAILLCQFSGAQNEFVSIVGVWPIESARSDQFADASLHIDRIQKSVETIGSNEPR